MAKAPQTGAKLPSSEQALDGRHQRSERSRRAIIEAAVALMGDGILGPTAQQISDRADVGMRTFFRHFEDMESLFVAVNEYTQHDYEEPFLGGDRSGTIEERVEKLVAQRADGYEKISKVLLSTQVHMWRSDYLKKNHDNAVKNLRLNLELWLPELKKLPRGQRDAADAVSSFDMWNRLREHQKLSKKASVAIVRELLNQLMEKR